MLVFLLANFTSWHLLSAASCKHTPATASVLLHIALTLALKWSRGGSDQALYIENWELRMGLRPPGTRSLEIDYLSQFKSTFLNGFEFSTTHCPTLLTAWANIFLMWTQEMCEGDQNSGLLFRWKMNVFVNEIWDDRTELLARCNEVRLILWKPHTK